MILRIACDSANRVYGYAKDKRTLQPAILWQGSSIELECALFQGGEMLLPINVGIIVVEIKSTSAVTGDPPAIRRNIMPQDCDPLFTRETWLDGSRQLFYLKILFDRDDADMPEVASLTAGVYRLVIYHLEPGLEQVQFFNACFEVRSSAKTGMSSIGIDHIQQDEGGDLIVDEHGDFALEEDWRLQISTDSPEI